jgi:hypothetical protein
MAPPQDAQQLSRYRAADRFSHHRIESAKNSNRISTANFAYRQMFLRNGLRNLDVIGRRMMNLEHSANYLNSTHFNYNRQSTFYFSVEIQPKSEGLANCTSTFGASISPPSPR